MNVTRPILVAGGNSARAASFSLGRRSFVSDPYISNRDERKQNKARDNGKSAETWQNDKNPQDWKQSGEKSFEGIKAPLSDRARDQDDKGRFENESGGQGSYAAREQAAKEQARESSMNDKSNNFQTNQGSFGMSGSKDDPDKAQNYNSSWAKNNATTPTDKANNNSSRDSNSFGMLKEKAKPKDDGHSFDMKDKSNSGEKMKSNSSFGMNAQSAKGKEGSSVGINDLNDEVRKGSQLNKPAMSPPAPDSDSSFGMDERSPTSERDRVRDGELNASSGMSDKKQTKSSFGLGNPKRDFSTTKEKAASAAQSVKETASSAAETIKEKASSAAQTIKDKAGSAEKSAADYGKQAADKVKEKAGEAKEYLDKKKNEKR